MVSHEVLLHLLDKSTVGANCFSTACAFQVEMTTVTSVISVYRALTDVSRESLDRALVYEALKVSVSCCL